MNETEALEILVNIGFAWASEYGFSDRDRAMEVIQAAEMLSPSDETYSDWLGE